MRKIKSRVFYSILFYSILFSSCKFWNEPVREYFDYWSSTCQVGKVEYVSENVTIDNVPNLSALNEIEISLYMVNPNGFSLLNHSPSFSFTLDDGTTTGSAYTEEMVDPTYVRIRTTLDDGTEGKRITLSGCLWPENRTTFTVDQLRESYPELFYSVSFIQNTPPDNIKNMTASGEGDFFPGTNMHYLYFKVPDQTRCRNKGCNFEVKYYLLDTDGTYYYKGSKILSLDDDKSPGDGTGFTWYFDEQDPYLFYDYTVQVLGPHGLKSEILATNERLGVHQLREPELSITNEPNGLFDEDGFECFEVASDSDSISYTSSVADAGDLLTVTVDGSVVTGTDGVYTLGGIGQHTIVATSSKDGSRPISVVKKIRIVKSLPDVSIDFDAEFNEKDTEDYWYIEVDGATGTVGWTVTATDGETPVSVQVDGSDFDSQDGALGIGKHTLTGVIHKPYCNDKSLSMKVNVVQKLTEPKIEFTNGSIDGDKIKFSYLTYDTLLMDITNTYPGATITTTIDGGTAQTGNLTSQKLDVGTHTIKVTVEKEYCATQEFVKSINVGIKQITAKLTKAEINISHNTKYEGTIKLYVIGGSEQVVRSYKSKNYLRNKFNGYSVPADYYLFFNSKSSKARFETFNSKAGYDPLRDVLRDFTLAEIKASNGYLDISSESYKKADSYSSENTYHHLWLSLSEGAAPADITFSPAVSCIDEANFECIEVENSSSEASYTISAQDGASISGTIDGVSFSGSKSGQLSLGEHTITVTSKQSGFTDTTVSKKIKVVQKLQEPVIKFYKESSHTNEIASTNDNAESGMTYKLYSNYNINLDADGNGQLYFDVSAESGTTVTVEETTINGDEETVTAITSGSLPLGPHILTFTVSKDGNTPVSVERKVYVQGLLAAPTFTPVGTKTQTDDDGTEHWQYSYKTYDEMPVNVTPGNTGNTVTLYCDGHKVSSASIGYNCSASITAVQTREYCKRRSDESAWMSVTIKPITLTFKKLEVKLSGFETDSFNAKGIISIIGNTKEGIIWDHKDDQQSVNQTSWCTPGGSYKSWSDTFTSPTQQVKIKFEDFRRHRGGITGDNPKFGDKTFPGISISSIKGAGWICTWDEASGGGSTKVQPRVTFTATE